MSKYRITREDKEVNEKTSCLSGVLCYSIEERHSEEDVSEIKC